MATTGENSIKAVLKLKLSDITKEMDKPDIVWIAKNPILKKIVSDIQYSEDIVLTSKKWDSTKLSNALKTLVRYELQLFATRIAKLNKDGAGKVTSDIEKKVVASYKDLVKSIEEKCSTALEELASNKGDNKKGLRDGKAALKKLEGVDLDNIFSVPRVATSDALKTLGAALLKAGDNDKLKKEAFDAAAKAADAARKGFDSEGKDAEAAIRFLLKTAQDIRKTGEANPILKKFGQDIEGYEKNLAHFVYKLEEFEIDLDNAANDIKSGKIDAKAAAAKAATMAATASLDKVGDKVLSALGDLKSEFAKVEKELK